MVWFGHAGIIPLRESTRNALAQWANDCERRLLGLHCGQMLDRRRHKRWAGSKVCGATIMLVDDSPVVMW